MANSVWDLLDALYGVRRPGLVWELGQHQYALLRVAQHVGIGLSVKLSGVGVDNCVASVAVKVVSMLIHP